MTAATTRTSETCIRPGCPGTVVARDHCIRHYQKLRDAGLLDTTRADPDQIRARIGQHLSRGQTVHGLALTAGIDPTGLKRFHRGDRRTVNKATADRLLRVPLPPTAETTAHQLATLRLLGCSAAQFARVAGIPLGTLHSSTRAGRFTIELRERVTIGYRKAISELRRQRLAHGIIETTTPAVRESTAAASSTPLAKPRVVEETSPTDRAEFAARYREHHATVHSRVLARTHDPHLAQDLTATAFARAWAKRAQFKGENYVGWVWTIARNLIIDHARSAEFTRTTVTDMATIGESHDLPATGGDPSEVATDRARVAHLLTGLTARQRELLTLRYLYDTADTEIAQALGMHQSLVWHQTLQALATARSAV